MAHFEEHCRDCEKKLGKRFESVNRWIDGCYKPGGSWEHRDIRHNLEGVKIIRELCGDEATEAAKLHILLDWKGFIIENQIPKDQREAELLRLEITENFARKKADKLGYENPYEEK